MVEGLLNEKFFAANHDSMISLGRRFDQKITGLDGLLSGALNRQSEYADRG
jgi:hypothetical protein